MLLDPLSNYFALHLIAALLIKHFIADFLLQTRYILDNKHIYGHFGGILHVLIHGLLSLGILITAPVSWLLAIALAVGEAVVHYHIDWVKERINRAFNWSATDSLYWMSFGFDQLLHHLTYVAMIAIIVGII